MFHHADSPEVIRAAVAEWNSRADAFAAEREAERLLAVERIPSSSRLEQMVGMLQRVLAPGKRMKQLSGQ